MKSAQTKVQFSVPTSPVSRWCAAPGGWKSIPDPDENYWQNNNGDTWHECSYPHEINCFHINVSAGQRCFNSIKIQNFIARNECQCRRRIGFCSEVHPLAHLFTDPYPGFVFLTLLGIRFYSSRRATAWGFTIQIFHQCSLRDFGIFHH